MEFTAQQIAFMLEGKVVGNDQASVSSLAKIEEGKTGSLSFLSNPKYESFLYSTEASIVIVSTGFVPSQSLPSSLTLIEVPDAYSAFAKLLHAYNQAMKPSPGISGFSKVAAGAVIGKDVHIGDWVSIEDGAVIEDGVILMSGVMISSRVKIGKNTHLFPGVKIYQDCTVGAECVIHANAVIGADGFGFAPNSSGSYDKVPQIGNVVIEDHVEIGSNTCIDRATMGSTFIRKGVKLDNLIQIAHNVEIGENTVMAAQCGVAGSTKIGKNCMIGGQVGFAGHIHIADGTKIAAQSGISQTIKQPNSVVQGTPAFTAMDFNKSYVYFKRLPQLVQDLTVLQKQVNS